MAGYRNFPQLSPSDTYCRKSERLQIDVTADDCPAACLTECSVRQTFRVLSNVSPKLQDTSGQFGNLELLKKSKLIAIEVTEVSSVMKTREQLLYYGASRCPALELQRSFQTNPNSHSSIQSTRFHSSCSQFKH
jgi:hypothetical protein